MAQPPGDEDPEILAEQAWKEMEKVLPFREFVRTWGPLKCGRWVARLHRDQAARKDLQALLEKSGFKTAQRIGRVQLDPLLSFIESHPVLRRHVRLGYRIQLAHTMRAALFGGEAIPAPDVKSEEWKALYDRLVGILAHQGKNDPFGKGDFFLVDDEVGEPGHKIELSNPDVLTPAFLKDLQKALQGWRNDWYVVIQLAFDDASPDLDDAMLVVWKDHVDEVIDREQMKSVLGARFKI